MKFKESKLAHKYLDGLKGLEIGASAHNPFGLDTLNVDSNSSITYEDEQMQLCGEIAKIDIVADGCEIPVKDESVDFIINSHVLEHFYNPIKALLHWHSKIKKGGYLFLIIPHKDRNDFDKIHPRTKLDELIERYIYPNSEKEQIDRHHNIWILEDVLELCSYLDLNVIDSQDPDDKVGNGFTVVIKK